MNSMKKRINLSLIGIGVATMLVTALICLITLSSMYVDHVRQDMEITADMLCSAYERGDTADLSIFNTSRMRVTLISPDGTVLFETDGNMEVMDNHLERPEIKAALEEGKGKARRISITMDIDMYYYAKLLEDGNIVRVSMQAESIFSIYRGMLMWMILVGGIIVIGSIVTSMILTRKLVDPVQRMAQKLDHVNEVDMYEELVPLADALTVYQKRNHELEKVRQEFTANVSHELKTPLTTISGYAEMIENGMVKAGDIPNCAGKIHKEAGRMLTLIGDILELSRLDEPGMQKDLQQVDLYQIAKQCLEMAELSAQKHQVQLFMEGTPSMVMGEKGMLEELVANLCDNAIRYNRPSGRVTITVKRDGITFNTILKVEDTGIGISEEDQRRIFERFYRVDKGRSRETGGTGLGLAIVKHIVQQHGAKIQIKSALDQGTCIKITFPQPDTDSKSPESES